MNIYTTRVQNKKYECAIEPSLQKVSQEYNVLATLKYFYPEKFEGFVQKDKPDLQKEDGSFGIEVTSASTEATMKASREFSKLKGSHDKSEIVRRIKTTGYKVVENNKVCTLISPLGTVQDEKNGFEQAVDRKMEKIETYSKNFSTVGLAIFMIDPPTREAEQNFPEWVRCCIQKSGGKCFDIYYILCHRFLLICNACGNEKEKKILTPELSKSLSTIGRMSAEGEIKLSDVEWQ